MDSKGGWQLKYSSCSRVSSFGREMGGPKYEVLELKETWFSLSELNNENQVESVLIEFL